jgi:hypothetical protein
MTEADGSLYDEDFYAWTQQQAELLRRGPAAANRLDYDLIAEEIEDLGLDQPVRHWRREIAEWRLQLKKKLTRSIAAKLDLPDRHREAVGLLRYMEDEVPGLLQRIPAECPYSLEQIRAEDRFPTPLPP